jgi:hypothetical protein
MVHGSPRALARLAQPQAGASVRKAKPIEELRGDPRFPFHVGQLIGAVEMASFWMLGHEAPEVKRMGERLQQSVGWFFVGGPTPTEGEEVGAWTPES